MSAACVYLVGAGPGDCGLITVRGRELLQRADVVIYDYLAHTALLDEVPDTAERIFVGKKGFSQHISQDEINELLVRTACEIGERGGSCVVRLKGGDPFVFGRGGEEAQALSRAGVPYEVVPGVTSGIAAPAYAGIPVTHRVLSSSITFVTGHEMPEKKESSLDWPAYAHMVKTGGTLCFYMGMRNLESIATRLMEEGLDADYPVALVQWGTSSAQRTLVSTLDKVEDAAREKGICAPAIIVVGQVVTLRDELAWFEHRPLFGRRLVVTRSRSQASGLVAQLCELGADVIEFPTIAFNEPDDFASLDEALGRIDTYDWLVFTSVNGVDAFFTRLQGDARMLAHTLVAAIGPATAERLAQHGIIADAVPSEYRGEAVFEEMQRVSATLGTDPAGSLEGARVLIARAQEAREVLPDLLQGAGAEVDVVAAYKTVLPDDANIDELAQALEGGLVDGVTFTSSSTVLNMLVLLGEKREALQNTKLFSIGPITSATLRESGFNNIVQAREYTVPQLVGAIVEEYS